MCEYRMYKDFKYWFYRDSYSTYAIYELQEGENPKILFSKVPVVTLENLLSNAEGYVTSNINIDRSILDDFFEFKKRPEYRIFEDFDVSEDPANRYDFILKGCCMINAWKKSCNPDISDISRSVISWLRGTDFYTCPGSTIYHDSHESGLLIHTLRVMKNILNFYSFEPFSSVCIENALICAAVHDWCKIGRYESYKKNVKDDVTGKWSQISAYKYKTDGFINLGHGTSSLYLASRFFNISAEMAAAIRWHMGEYNVADNEASELHECNEKYPLVFMLQFADRLSITKYYQ